MIFLCIWKAKEPERKLNQLANKIMGFLFNRPLGEIKYLKQLNIPNQVAQPAVFNTWEIKFFLDHWISGKKIELQKCWKSSWTKYL